MKELPKAPTHGTIIVKIESGPNRKRNPETNWPYEGPVKIVTDYSAKTDTCEIRIICADGIIPKFKAYKK